MGTRERPQERAQRRIAEQLGIAGREIHLARVGAGLSLRDVAAASDVSRTMVWRIERGRAPEVPLSAVSRVAAALGLEASLRLYPGGDPIRDAAHVALLGRLRARINGDLRWRTEVPLPTVGDLRAWDATIAGLGFVIGVEAETRIRDLQAVSRKVHLKQKDGELDHVILLVSDTKSNRLALRLGAADLRETFPVDQRDCLRALRDGRDPGGSSIIVL
jgi:transcriptional regulator with XRE-family HTH domain